MLNGKYRRFWIKAYALPCDEDGLLGPPPGKGDPRERKSLNCRAGREESRYDRADAGFLTALHEISPLRQPDRTLPGHNVFIPITEEQVPMDRQQLIRLGIVLVIGIVIGVIIGFALWHGGSGTCAIPPSNAAFS